MSSLLHLSEDILLEICRYISPIDLLSLKQTGRALYAFGCTDYVWHQLQVDLPLDIPPFTDSKALSASRLQPLVTHALRLDHNWRQQWSQVKRTAKIDHGDILSHMQLLDCSQWLFTMARSHRSKAHISLWSLHDMTSVHRVVHFEIPCIFKTYAGMQRNNKEIIFAVIVRLHDSEFMSIYSVQLDDDALIAPKLIPPRLIHTIEQQPHLGIFTDLHVHAHYVVAKLFKLTGRTIPHTSFLLINTQTGVIVAAYMKDLHLSNVQIRLFDEHVVVTGVKADMALINRVYRLPDIITSPFLSTTSPPFQQIITIDDFGLPVLVFDPLPIKSDAEYHTSDDISKSEGLMVLCVDPSIDSPRHSGEFVARCLLPPSIRTSPSHTCPSPSPSPSPSLSNSTPRLPTTPIRKYPITTSPHSLPEEMCIGTSGYRVVWVERSWETDEFKFMKLTLPCSPEERPVVGPLFPPHTALPFRVQSCQSLAFDDAAGRLCVGLHSGEIYLFDFV